MMLVQIGVGSGGIIVCDLLIREPTITSIVLVDPDIYEAHNVHRHLFPAHAVGMSKVQLAADWVKQFRPDLTVIPLQADVMAPEMQAEIGVYLAACQLIVCAVDGEVAKFHVDTLARKYHKPWTLGEVLSGGIAGWVHVFEPGGACYGCVASHLKRNVTVESPAAPVNYANANATQAEIRIPASRAAISVIASLQATCSLDVLRGKAVSFTSMLLPLTTVDGIFTETLRPYRFQIPRSQECLVCANHLEALSGEQLDAALDQALARLAHE